jgi:hypothetical protein
LPRPSGPESTDAPPSPNPPLSPSSHLTRGSSNASLLSPPGRSVPLQRGFGSSTPARTIGKTEGKRGTPNAKVAAPKSGGKVPLATCSKHGQVVPNERLGKKICPQCSGPVTMASAAAAKRPAHLRTASSNSNGTGAD